jgi:iron complex outermembrane receptor protein
MQYQENRIGGYSFLLPEYRRVSSGALWLSSYRPHPKWFISGGIRYDYGRLEASSFSDDYLVEYLRKEGYEEGVVEANRWRSYPVDRVFGDFSGALGMVWHPHPSHWIKANVGRGFRLPGANELASNGVHHGTFRHEQGDERLGSERGWQIDASYSFEKGKVGWTITPFGSWYGNYIYLKPTGEWSILPHAGQIYRYAEAETAFAGVEAELVVDLWRGWSYRAEGACVYSYNIDERIPLPFSPPGSFRNRLDWQSGHIRIYGEWERILSQNRVSRNEDVTPGANLWNMGASLLISLWEKDVEITFLAQNLLETKYYNHLSFYRKVEIPEPGRNFQLFIKIPFKNRLK